MEPRIFHGEITPEVFARALLAEFNRGNFRAQQVGNDQQMAVQITTRDQHAIGGQTAISVLLQKVEDGVAIQVGQQAWLGVAASLGETALATLLNPWNLIGRLDDVAQDIESLQIPDRVWAIIENTARVSGASFELSERLKRMVCSYCQTANPVGESNCIACGAPLGLVQPRTCKKCGFVVRTDESVCPNCGQRL